MRCSSAYPLWKEKPCRIWRLGVCSQRCAQGRCATRLRYAPTISSSLILKYFSKLRNDQSVLTVSKPCQNSAARPEPCQNREGVLSIG
jgi:hypothetical protein